MITPKELEDLLIRTKTELLESFKHGTPTELDVATKAIIDYQELIARALFNELNNIENLIANYKGDIIKDNRERYMNIMKILDEISKK